MASRCSRGRCACFLALICLALAPSLLLAQSASWPLDGPAFSATPEQITVAAVRYAPEKDTDVTVLFEEEKYRLDATGRATHVSHLIYRIETPAGVENWSQVSVEWESFFQDQPSIRARVIPPGGQPIELDQKTVTNVASRDPDDGTLSDDRVRKAPLPGLSVGSIVEEETTAVDKEPFFTGGGLYSAYFQRRVPVERCRLTVEAPANTPLNYRAWHLPQVSVKDEKEAGMRRVTFDQGYLPAWVDPDIDLVTPLPQAPAIEFSTGKSWRDVATAYGQLTESQIHPEQAKELLPKHSTGDRMATVAELVAALHKNVRYTGVEFGKARLQPQTASEVLERHYGDCKDKAALLVAMLRAAGIEAHLALLHAGPGVDITPELPGIGGFDHAIVYVPANGSNPPLWIDATAEFTRVGNLPYADQGRQALIIAGNTNALTLTPEARPEDSVDKETRDFFLADYGPAHVVESSDTAGYVDAGVRFYYGGPENQKVRQALQDYVRSAYSAKALTSVEHGDAKDFSKPFLLRLDIAGTKRGQTFVGDAAVGLDPTGTWSSLPKWFTTDADSGDSNQTPEEQERRRKAEAQRSSEYEIQPFIDERRYRIVPPAGFTVRSLPSDQVISMGPASLSEKYTVDSSGVVTAVFRFTTGKSRYTVDEALALQKAVLSADKLDAPVITFEQVGEKLLSQGKAREAFAADRELIAARPKDAVQHVRMAYALLEAGVGELAQSEARKATQLDPQSALSWSTLGWVLEHNAIGVLREKGFDLGGAVAAYSKAEELDPDDIDTREKLATAEEYDSEGLRYTSVPGLERAIAEYKALKARDKSAGEQYEDNLLYCLFYAHHYADLLTELSSLPENANRQSLGIAATVASEGTAAGLRRANQVSGETEDRNWVFRQAGVMLIDLRMYPEAVEVLRAAPGQQGKEAAKISQLIETYQGIHPYEPQPGADQDPTTVVRNILGSITSGQLTDSGLAQIYTRHAFETEQEWQDLLKANRDSENRSLFQEQQSVEPPLVEEDLVLGNAKFSAQGDDSTGYRVTWQPPYGAPTQSFVVKEDGSFKIVGRSQDTLYIGNEALYLVRQGNVHEAESLLDWERGFIHIGGGEDPLAGWIFPVLWTSGETKGAAAVETAAASLIEYFMDPNALLSIASKAAAEGGADKLQEAEIQRLLIVAYIRTGKLAQAKPIVNALLASYPDSATALRQAGQYYLATRDWADWQMLFQQHLAKHPSDWDLLRDKVYFAEAHGDWGAASQSYRKIMDGGQATGDDFNGYAWNALVAGAVDDDAIRAADRAAAISDSSDFNSLHTLACVYAVQGRTAEARQTLLKAMDSASMVEPNSAVWFAMGLIYEQYGLKDAAIAAYRRVEPPEDRSFPFPFPEDTWVLAQNHLKALHD